MSKHCIHAVISGRVQGVFYRANTQKQAMALGLTGWVRNLADGRVELMACGEAPELAKLQEWLWQGPSAAKVSDVVITPKVFETISGFQIIK